MYKYQASSPLFSGIMSLSKYKTSEHIQTRNIILTNVLFFKSILTYQALNNYVFYL